MRRDGFLEEHQDLTYVADADAEWEIARKLFTIILNDARTNTVGVRALAEAFVYSGSYDSTRYLYPLLNKQERIESEQLRRLEYAIASNGQVSDCTLGTAAMPDLINAIIKRHDPEVPADPWASAPPF